MVSSVVFVFCAYQDLSRFIFFHMPPKTIAVDLQGMVMASRSGPQELQGFPNHRGFSRGTGVWKQSSEGGLQISGLMG